MLSDLYSVTEEEMIQAFLNIFKAVRSHVREDFLILINANRTKTNTICGVCQRILHGGR